MKRKNYSKPTAEIVRVRFQGPLAASSAYLQMNFDEQSNEGFNDPNDNNFGWGGIANPDDID